MRIENLKVKENISLNEKIAAIDYIVERCFDFDEDGYVSDYRPYLKEIGIVESIATFFIDGLYFDNNEIIYEAVTSNDEVAKLIDSFFTKTKSKKNLTYEQNIMQFVIDHVDDKLDYMKQLYIAQLINKKDSLSSLLDMMKNKIDEMNITDINNGMKAFSRIVEMNKK